MSSVSFFLHDAEGNIASSGQCQSEVLSLMGRPGMTLRTGSASPLSNYFDIASGEVRVYDAEAIQRRERHPGTGFRWSLGQWVDERSLTEAKLQKWESIKAARSVAEFSTFTVGGYVFDADRDSQVRLQSAFQSAMDARTNGEPFSIDWTLSDGTEATLTRAQVIAVGRALQAHVSAQFQKAKTLKAAITAATSIQELDGISW